MVENSLMEKTLCCYKRNNLYGFLSDTFGEGIVVNLQKHYTFGTAKRWPGANVFWYQDGNRQPIDALVTCLSRVTGKPVDGIQSAWLTETMGQELDVHKCSVLFYGHHLLNEKSDCPVALVENEISAIVCSYFLPQYIWLAASSLELVYWENTDVRFLEHRQVVVFPSLLSFSEWKQISIILSGKDIQCVVSDYLERHANEQEKAEGLGIADFLLRKILVEKETNHLKSLSPAEQLGQMKAENPAIQMLIDVFGLELVNTVVPCRIEKH